ncbi:MAG: hypothetical protein V4440_02645, partial [Pseudomonadota bacterium]
WCRFNLELDEIDEQLRSEINKPELKVPVGTIKAKVETKKEKDTKELDDLLGYAAVGICIHFNRISCE